MKETLKNILIFILLNNGIIYSQTLFDLYKPVQRTLPLFCDYNAELINCDVVTLNFIPISKQLYDSLKKFNLPSGTMQLKGKIVVDSNTKTNGYIIQLRNFMPNHFTYLILTKGASFTDCLMIGSSNSNIIRDKKKYIGRICSVIFEESIRVFKKLETDSITDYHIEDGKFIESKY